jgi:hypothetical protein
MKPTSVKHSRFLLGIFFSETFVWRLRLHLRLYVGLTLQHVGITDAMVFTVSFPFCKKILPLILASKDVLVIAGEMVIDLAKAQGVTILPRYNEHNAIFHCTRGDHSCVRRLWRIASGGNFWNREKWTFENATVDAR